MRKFKYQIVVKTTIYPLMRGEIISRHTRLELAERAWRKMSCRSFLTIEEIKNEHAIELYARKSCDDADT